MYKLPNINLYSNEVNEIIHKKLPIVVFGNGILGKAVVDLLLDMKIEVINICDNNSQVVGTKYRGIEVISPTQIKDKDVYVIVAVYEYMQEITSQLNSIKIFNILPYYCCFRGQNISREFYWNNDASIQEAMYLEQQYILSKGEKNIVINSLDIGITEKCSLKCRNCSNLIQYYESPRDSDFEKTKLAMNRLFHCVDLIGRVSILGGEPLVNKEVAKYVEECSKNDKIVNILVVTNGTIIPNDELITTINRDARCVLSISNYGALSLHKEDIINLSEDKKFKIAISRREEGIWRELGRIEYVDLSDNDVRDKYNQCMMKKFITLKDGKLFICPFTANAYALKAIAKADVEFIDLIDETVTLSELKQRIREFLKEEIHYGCKYCIEEGKRAKLIPAAVQVKNPMSYNKYTY